MHMKKFTLFIVAALMAVSAMGQQQVINKSARLSAQRIIERHSAGLALKSSAAPQKAPEVISEQPEGELRLYERSGSVYTIDEAEGSTEDNRIYEPYVYEQTGVSQVVFAADNTVYIQNMLNGLLIGTWVKGTLSADGKTITVPMGQSLYYHTRYNANIVLAVADVPTAAQVTAGAEPTKDASVTSVTLTIDGNKMTLNGTSAQKILTAYWDDDNSWYGYGDFETVLTLFTETPVTVPTGLESEEWEFTATMRDGSSTSTFNNAQAALYFSGNDVYLQGFTGYLPEGAIKGVKNADGSLTFASGQYCGMTSDGDAIYFCGYDYDNEQFGVDVTFTFDNNATYTTQQMIIINGSKNTLSYYAIYYPGATISQVVEQPVITPLLLQTSQYTMKYTIGEETATRIVNVGFFGNNVYVQGIWEYLPEAWIKGTISGNIITFDAAQFLGAYSQNYPKVYFMPFAYGSDNTPALTSQMVCQYDATAKTFSTTDYVAFTISKTSLSALDYFQAPSFTPFVEVAATPAQPTFGDVMTWSPWDDTAATPSAGFYFYIPDTDAEGNILNTDKLYYQLFSEINGTVAPIVLDKTLYNFSEDLSVIPYSFSDNDYIGDMSAYAALYGVNRAIVLLSDAAKTYNKIGVRSIYTGGGETKQSEIAWFDIDAAMAGIETISGLTVTKVRTTDLSGRAVPASAKGLVIKTVTYNNGMTRTFKVVNK